MVDTSLELGVKRWRFDFGRGVFFGPKSEIVERIIDLIYANSVS
jgi:hypothetical protein